jgi:hypothetical protein
MQEKDFRVIFPLVLAFCALGAMLFTATMFAEPTGISYLFRMVVCAGVIAGLLGMVVVDLFGIWTGHLPGQHKH